jgi:pimeloyl-ACP methyl ester carboxylesterase
MPYLTVAGTDLYSEVVGSGDPVLLLHGGFCSLESLRIQSDLLAQDYAVHAYERPGHGRSPDIDDEYSYSRGVAEALDYLDAAGLNAVHIIGYSDGAIIGLLLALDHPERVRSLVAISANLDPTGFAHSPELAEVPMLLPLSKARNGDADGPDLERELYASLSPDGPAHAQVVLDKLFRLWKSEPHIDPARLAGISAPTLVMAGDRDTIRPDHTLRIASSIPDAQLCIVPGASHNLVAERPRLIGAIIREFLGQLR